MTPFDYIRADGPAAAVAQVAGSRGATFLASPAAGYVSGTSIPVDGGRLHCV